MRLFIAAPLPELVVTALKTQQAQYQTEGVRLVPTQNLHLTLHFLGETPATSLPDMKQKFREIAASHPGFRLTLQEIAPGPKLNSPRLVWARFNQHPDFTQLARTIQVALDAAPEHPGEYIPHITIARLKKDKPKNLTLPLLRDIDFLPYQVTSFGIWQSELGSPHPRYSILEEFSLLPALK